MGTTKKEIRISQPELRSFGHKEAMQIMNDFNDLKLTMQYAIKDVDEVCKILGVSPRTMARAGDVREFLVNQYTKELIKLIKTKPALFHGC